MTLPPSRVRARPLRAAAPCIPSFSPTALMSGLSAQTRSVPTRLQLTPVRRLAFPPLHPLKIRTDRLPRARHSLGGGILCYLLLESKSWDAVPPSPSCTLFTPTTIQAGWVRVGESRTGARGDSSKFVLGSPSPSHQAFASNASVPSPPPAPAPSRLPSPTTLTACLQCGQCGTRPFTAEEFEQQYRPRRARAIQSTPAKVFSEKGGV